MNLDPPRRALAVLTADNEIAVLRRSAGWPSEAAAREATQLLDTGAASCQVRTFVGFIQQTAESWAFVRGGVADAPEVAWREAVVFGHADFARVRFDPFRMLPTAQPVVDAPATQELETVSVSDAGPSEDAARLRALQARGSGAGREALAFLLGAVLDTQHTLVTGSPWAAEDIELLLLLLPPRLRTAVTFHTYATSLPREPIPRLVLTQLDEDWPFDTAVPVWGHRLPATTSEIRSRAMAAARGLVALLDAPARLAEAHDAYGRYADVLRAGHFDLLHEAERVVLYDAVAQARDARDATAALRLLSRAAPTESDVLFTTIRSALPASELTAALAGLLVEDEPARMAPVAERFVRSPRGAAEVIRALATAPAGGPAGRRVVAGVQCARTAYRGLPAEQWETGLTVADALLELCRAVASSGSLAAEGGWGGASAPPARPPAGPVASHAAQHGAHSDADVFLGFLGVDASIDRPARWELIESGPSLAAEVLARIRRAAPDQAEPTEAVHWSFALIERVRLGQVDNEFLILATALLRHALPRGAGTVLREYLDRKPATASWLLQNTGLRDLLGSTELAAHWAAGLREVLGSRELAIHWAGAIERALNEARTSGDLMPVEAACQQLARAGGVVHEPQLLQRVAGPLRQLVDQIVATHPRREASARLTALHSLLAYVVAPEAAPALRRLVFQEPEPAAEAPPPESPPKPNSLRPPRLEPTPDEAPPLLVGGPEPRRPRRALLAAAAVALVAGAALVANVLLRADGDGGVNIRAGGVMGPPATPPPQVAPPQPTTLATTSTAGAPNLDVPDVPATRDEIAAELAEARLHARSEDWGRVVEVLAVAAPDASFPESFAYDSLLAASALRHAMVLPDQDTTRQRLLQIARGRSTRALEAIASFAPGADELRLLRAEACIAGRLACDATRTAQDLILAARSPSSRVSARAADVLARWGR